LFAIESEMATGVAKGLVGQLSEEMAGSLTVPASRNAEAYELYLRGASAMQANTSEANSTALAYFDRALKLDQNLSEAMIGIGAVNLSRCFFGSGGPRELEVAYRSFERA